MRSSRTEGTQTAQEFPERLFSLKWIVLVEGYHVIYQLINPILNYSAATTLANQ